MADTNDGTPDEILSDSPDPDDLGESNDYELSLTGEDYSPEYGEDDSDAGDLLGEDSAEGTLSAPLSPENVHNVTWKCRE